MREMAHFHPLNWEIDLRAHAAAELERDPVVQATFVHEYVHYVQALTSTIGRHILVELARLAVLAGLQKHHGGPPPDGFSQIDLERELKDAAPSDFHNTPARDQYRDLSRDLEFALSDQATGVPVGTRAHEFRRQRLTIGPHSVDDFVHVTASLPSGTIVAVPITDRVVFENMARQVQRNFLRFNNTLDTSPIDSERRKSHGDVTYVCLRDLLGSRLPSTEDAAKWTITLCQLALQCRNPGTAFEHMIGRLNSSNQADLAAFLETLNRDSWFKGEFNEPPVQEVLNELVSKWGTAMLPRENWELREFTKLIANACNALRADSSLMAAPLLAWKDIGRWLTSFGCPPVTFSDGATASILGVAATAPWLRYLGRLGDLMR
jgi:hypothetical protein